MNFIGREGHRPSTMSVALVRIHTPTGHQTFVVGYDRATKEYVCGHALAWGRREDDGSLTIDFGTPPPGELAKVLVDALDRLQKDESS